MKNKKKAIISDWDDTKVSTFRTCIKLYADFATRYSLRIPSSADVLSHWGKPIDTITKSLWPDVEYANLKSNFWNYAKTTKFIVKPFPGINESVITLKDKGFMLGIVSSSSTNVILETISKFFTFSPDIYAFIQTSDDVPFHKPDPRVFDIPLVYLEKQGVTREETIYVGDSINDYYASRDANVDFYAVTTGFTPKKAFSEIGLAEKKILSSFNELTNIF